ncbi:MAG: hypothetical protein OJI67_16305, partial [Prosthecobacter sp.]|nr:hypothetical protein [Prosthecobacter sp.]
GWLHQVGQLGLQLAWGKVAAPDHSPFRYTRLWGDASRGTIVAWAGRGRRDVGAPSKGLVDRDA